MTDVLWQPSEAHIKSTHLYQFSNIISKKYHCSINNYSDLHKFSIDNMAEFWQEVWDFFAIKAKRQATTVLENEQSMTDAQWFNDAKINFAENLLSQNNDELAIISIDENNTRRELSYRELYMDVASLAKALKKMGVSRGTRVAGLMPNTLETVVAMLATTSLGAIWSSCSPDFGFGGIIDRFGQIEPTILFTTDGYFYNGKSHSSMDKVKELSQHIDSLEKIVVVPFVDSELNVDTIDKAVLYSDIKIPCEELTFEYLSFNDPLYIMYSSGTTGVPKCIVHGVGGTLIQHVKELGLHTNVKPGSRIFYFTTCGWMMWNWLVSALALKATLVLYDGSPTYPHMNRLLNLIDKEQINIFGTSAKFLQSLEKEKMSPKESHSLDSLQVVLSTGSPLSIESFHYVYEHFKSNLQLSSISGGTDIVSCFALGSPTLPVYAGELQCKGLGMDIAIYDDNGKPIINQKGELVCQSPFPSRPIYFWNDKQGEKFHEAYFAEFANTWAHGDYAMETSHQGIIIYGRSDALLNPGGVRIGTAEIYREVDKIDDVIDSVAIGQAWDGDTRIILFVQLSNGVSLDETLIKKIKQRIRKNTSPRHVPQKILQVSDIPRTISGKIVEVAVRKTVNGEKVDNIDALKNPESLREYENRPELKE